MSKFETETNELCSCCQKLSDENKMLRYTCTRYLLIQRAVDAQTDDYTLWATKLDGTTTIMEDYLQESLRDLHRVIEGGDEESLDRIIERSKES